MKDLGRRGGLRGGPARAKKLDASRRVAIARAGAAARWKPTVLTLTRPKNLAELHCFVAQYGNGRAHTENCDPVGVLISAVAACRDDAGLARMIPVYLHRAHDEILADPKRLLAVSAEEARVLGYFLELTARLGDVAVPANLLRGLRRKFHANARPVALFRRELAESRASSLAASWKLVVSEPDESYESYFTKMTGNQRPIFRRRPKLRAAP